jgi:rhodanese-related sulfurtransferase
MINSAKIFLFIIASFILCNQDTAAQNKRMVESKSYNLLLKKLLKHDVPEISIDSLSKIKNTVLLLDAREFAEFNVSHLKNAKFVGYEDFSIDSLHNTKKNQPIVIYCSVGYRSEKITEKLMNAGFTNVQNLYGGIFEWKNKNFEVFNANGITNNVHPYSKTWGLWLKNADKVYKTPGLSTTKN